MGGTAHDDWLKVLEVSAARFFNQFQFSATFNCFMEGVGGSRGRGARLKRPGPDLGNLCSTVFH